MVARDRFDLQDEPVRQEEPKPRVPPMLRSALIVVGYTACYVALSKAGLVFATPEGVSPWYPATGLSLALLLSGGLSYLPAVFCASVLADLLLSPRPLAPWTVLAIGVIKTGGYGLAALALRNAIRIDPRLRRVRDTGWFLLLALVASLAVAALSRALLAVLGDLPWPNYLPAVFSFWVGDAIGVLLLTPTTLLALSSAGAWVRRTWPRGSYAGTFQQSSERRPVTRLVGEVVGQAASVVLVLWLVFGSPIANDLRLFHLCLLPLIWIALRHGQTGAMLGVSAMNLGAMLAVRLFGFALAGPTELSFLMLVLSLTGLLLGAAVSERMQATTALRASEERFRIISEMVSDYAYSYRVEPDGTLTKEWVTQAFSAITGYTPEESEARGGWAQLVYPEDMPIALQCAQALLAGREDVSEFRIVAKNGQVVWLRDYGHPMWDKDHTRVVRLVGAATDITERKLAQAENEVTYHKYQSLVRALGEVTYEHLVPEGIIDWSEAFEQVLGYTQSEMGSDERSWLDRVHPDDLPAVESEFERALRENHLYDLEYRFRHKSGEYRWVHDRGVMHVGEDGRLETVIGVMKDITERKRAEGALRESEERLRLLAENVQDAVWLGTPDTGGQRRLLYVSPAFERVFGVKPEQVYKSDSAWLETVHEADRDRVLDALEAFLRDENEYALEYRIVRADGAVRWVEARGFAIRDQEGGIYRTCGIARDVTERKRAEDALRESEERYRSLFEAAMDHIFVVDRDLRYVMVNPNALRAGGLTPEGVVGKGPQEVFPEDAEFYLSHYRQVFESGEPVRFERDLRLPDGIHCFSVTLSPIKDAQGRATSLTGISRDITERKRAEAALRKRDQEIRLIADNVPALVSYVDAGGHYRFVSKRYEEWFGIPQTEIVGKHYSQVLGEDTYEAIRDRVEAALSGQRVHYEEALPYASGGPRWVNAWYVPDTDDQGQVNGFFALVTDIAERKRTEEALGEAEKRYRDLYDNAPVMYHTIDTKGIVLECNQTEADMLGYSKEEIIGQPIYAFETKEFQNLAPHALHEGMKKGHAAGERRCVKKDGTIIDVALDATAIYDDSGQVVGFRSTFADITERKRAEEARAHSQRTLLALSQAAQVVQRARTPDEVYRAVGDEISRLGYQATILTLTDDRAHLAVSHLTLDSAVVRAVGKLLGVSLQDFRIPLVPGGLYRRVVFEGMTIFVEATAEPLAEALPEPLRPLVSRVRALLDLHQSILASLTVGGEAHGLLIVSGNDLAEADVSAVSTFANQAAIALENVRLLYQVSDDREQVRALSQRLVEVQEMERAHIARELHDQVGQILTGLNLLLGFSARAPAEVIETRQREAQDLVEELMSRVDEISLNLRPAMLDDLGLLPALLWHVERYEAQTGVHVRLEHSGLERRFSSQVETAAYRLVQEGLTNVARHAGASEVAVRLWCGEGVLEIQIEDRGVGFDSHSAAAGGGLSGIRQRVMSLGGQTTVESAPGQGTRLITELPVGGGEEEAR